MVGAILKRSCKHCRRSKDEFISNVLLWTPAHGPVSVGRSARDYFHQLCTGKGCNLEELLGEMDDWDGWRQRERERERDSGKSVLSALLDDNNNFILKRVISAHLFAHS